jgi:hypothetical protein
MKLLDHTVVVGLALGVLLGKIDGEALGETL